MSAHFSVVSFATAYRVNRLDGNACGLEKLGSIGVRGRNIGGESVAFIEPIGLAEFPDNAAVCGEVAEDAFTDIANRVG